VNVSLGFPVIAEVDVHVCYGFLETGIFLENALPLTFTQETVTLLDKYLWQALGKALGWKREGRDNNEWHHNLSTGKPWWLYRWHRFIDWIAEGKDVDEFFEQLIKRV